jgi:acetyl-CoA carboxylase biotin carboxylase subunit
MFKKILIANRAEIAVRVIRACQEMGISTVAVYSEVDAKAPHVHLADEAVLIGPPAPSESYLNMDKIIAAVRQTGAEAIHPGYGFLSENPEFAMRCETEGIVFIGPKSDVIAKMGNKVEAKKVMNAAGVPTVPGYNGDMGDLAKVAAECGKIGYPVIVKAAAGGGGKGMHVVETEADLALALETARREAKSAFGDDTVFIEKYLAETRHIEIQVLGDNQGNVLHLFERECSIQRRHQKVIEETPSPALTPKMREKMGLAGVMAAKAAGYTNAGTCEFMFAGGNFYFLEMNTRLQVEHAITEMTTGIDIVKWQIRIAAGEELTLSQSEITQRGHAIECRIYAEDPEKGFMPSTGTVHKFEAPSGMNVRHDSGIESGSVVTPYYDPMLAKLIVSGETRDDAIRKMDWALSNYLALGVATNLNFLKAIINHPEFKAGNLSTHFIERYFKDWNPSEGGPPAEILIAAAIEEAVRKGVATAADVIDVAAHDNHSPWKTAGKWRVGG